MLIFVCGELPISWNIVDWYVASREDLTYSVLVFVGSGRKCSGPGSVTALICYGRNRTRHRIFTFVRTLLDNLLKSKCCTHTLIIHYVNRKLYNCLYTVQSKLCWLTESISYAIYLAKTLHMIQLRNNKCSEAGPKRRTLFRPGTIPVPVSVLVLSLLCTRCEWPNGTGLSEMHQIYTDVEASLCDDELVVG